MYQASRDAGTSTTDAAATVLPRVAVLLGEIFDRAVTLEPSAGSQPLAPGRIAAALRAAGLHVHPLATHEVAGWVGPRRAALAVGDAHVAVVRHAARRTTRASIVTATCERERAVSRRSIARVLETDAVAWLGVETPADLEPACARGRTLNPWRRVAALARLERRDIAVVVVYAVTLGLLSVVTPVATQALVNTIAFGAILQPLVVLTIALLVGLGLAGGLSVLQSYIVEVLQRRVLVRVAEDLSRRLPSVASSASDRHDLVELNNRFLDVVTIQKSAAELLLVGLGLALQIGVGLLLLALYHPALLAFSVVLLVALVAVIALARGGTASAIAESKSKYEIVAWLDELARQPALFAAGPAATFAAHRASERIHRYVQARRRHYRHVFAVLVGGATLQVLAVVVLLAVGGYLVIDRQLTLGQLVASEIVVGAIAIGIGKLGRLADKSFDLVAATDKLGNLLDLPLRERHGDALPATAAARVEARGLRADSTAAPATFTVEPGNKVLVDGGAGAGKSRLLEVLAGHRPGAAGAVAWDGRARPALDELARSVQLVARRAPLVRGSILDNLRVADATLDERAVWQVLEAVGLARRVDALGGLGTQLLPSGAPLSGTQVQRLLLARAWVARPRLLLIDEALDFLDDAVVETFVGADAPWSAVVVSRDPAVRARFATAVELPAVEEASHDA